MNYLDLFSGIGGFTLGLQSASIPFDWHGYSEIDPYAESVYQLHFTEAERMGDVTKINTKELPELDLITFGWPCQDISIAGHRGGLQASRSGLFFEATRIIRATRPRYFIAENVKGLFSSNEGADFEIVLQEITDIGYDCQWQLLNTRWVLPQNRERVYFIGHLRGEPRPEVFPFTKDTFESAQEEVADRDDIASTLTVNYYKGPSLGYGGKGRQLINHDPEGESYKDEYWGKLHQVGQLGNNTSMGQRVYDTDGVSSCLRGGGGGQGGKTGLYFDSLHGFGHGWQGYHNKKAVNKGMIRRLTPTECERLQGFPDGWTENLSDTRRYMTLGNAVSVPLIYHIGLKLRRYLNEKQS